MYNGTGAEVKVIRREIFIQGKPEVEKEHDAAKQLRRKLACLEGRKGEEKHRSRNTYSIKFCYIFYQI
eukprot:Seg417.6 transcript_id=Seg417.6/GoldUCD/mRNA.D3Y31 product="hypothetical protein" pseudo=true protein_id=Seg417.6/GoldUCD/D3Y31